MKQYAAQQKSIILSTFFTKLEDQKYKGFCADDKNRCSKLAEFLKDGYLLFEHLLKFVSQFYNKFKRF